MVVLLLTSIVGMYTWKAFFRKDDGPPTQLPWVPIDVNKRRSFVNQTRDAGMFTERTRRVANIGANNCGVDMKSPYQKHFSNGVMDTFLTGICAVSKVVVVLEPPPEPLISPTPSFGYDLIIDGTFANSILQSFILEGNGGSNAVTIDGNPGINGGTPNIIVENSDASPSFFSVLFEGMGMDFSAILDGNLF